MIPAIIAHNTWREAVRDRVMLGMTIAGAIVMLAVQVLSPLALGEGRRITVDLGLTTISLLGLLAILMVGTSLVAKEIERRTIFNLLSRPIARPLYLVGKWAGLTASLWTVAAALGIVLSALYTLGFYCVGQWSYDLRAFADQFPQPVGSLVRGVSMVVPNLPLFNMRSLAAAGEATSGFHLLLATGYAILVSACVLALASAAFESRDFK